MERPSLRIGELAQAAKVSTAAIRHYESVGVLPAPSRTAAGYRLYGHDAVGDVQFVRGAQVAGLTLAQIAILVRCRSGGRVSAEDHQMLSTAMGAVRTKLVALGEARSALAEVMNRHGPAEACDCPEGPT